MINFFERNAWSYRSATRIFNRKEEHGLNRTPPMTKITGARAKIFMKNGILRQPYRIRLDLEKLSEKIVDVVSKAVLASCEIGEYEVFNYEMADDLMDIKGSYTTSYKSEYWLATRESPEEYEIQREHISDSEIKINQEINLGDYISIHSIDEPEDEVEEID